MANYKLKHPENNCYKKKTFVCANCSSTFITYDRPTFDPKKSKHRFCNANCYTEFRKGNNNPNFKGARPCRYCGTHVMGAQRTFCNLECNSKFYEEAKEKRAPMEKLNRNMRRAVISCLRRGVKSGRSWRSLTGFSSIELMNHLEAKFRDGMNWNNYGPYWHIDHIRPVASFQFTKPEDEQFKQCWSLENLQPLLAKENIKKGSIYNGKRNYRVR